MVYKDPYTYALFPSKDIFYKLHSFLSAYHVSVSPFFLKIGTEFLQRPLAREELRIHRLLSMMEEEQVDGILSKLQQGSKTLLFFIKTGRK